MPWTRADPVPEVTTPVWRLTKTLMALKWLPPSSDGSVSPAMAHLKRQGAVSSLLGCRAREGLGPEREDRELALEQHLPGGPELAALWPESLCPLSRAALTRAPTGTPALTP